jgi:hypothetical protein
LSSVCPGLPLADRRFWPIDGPSSSPCAAYVAFRISVKPVLTVPADRLREQLLAKYVHVVGYRRQPGLNLFLVCPGRPLSGLVVVRDSGQALYDLPLTRWLSLVG